jgi:hypothetical protein
MTVYGEMLRRDVHPAELLLPDGTILTDVRVFITTHRLLAFKTNAERQIEQCLELTLEQPCTVPADHGTLHGRLEARLADGGTVWVNRGQGCGCGSPLKAFAAPVTWTGR